MQDRNGYTILSSNSFEVWNGDDETWTRVTLLVEDLAGLSYIHSKTVNAVEYDFFKDPHDRWFRGPTDDLRLRVV